MTTYKLNRMQQYILTSNGYSSNFNGDDNDFSCLLSQIALKLFTSNDRDGAYVCFLNDPMACDVSRTEWAAGMEAIAKRHAENEAACEAHANAMSHAD